MTSPTSGRAPTLGAAETLDPRELGLEAGDRLPFEFRPGQRPSPLVVSFPHVGLSWPSELGPRPQVSFPRNADYAVDRLYLRAEALGAATVRAHYSRLVVDLNRADDDVSTELVPDHPAARPQISTSIANFGALRRPIRNRGVVWATAVGNIPLFTSLAHAQLERRLDRYYRPYYRALERLLERRRRRFGYAILLDAHSMPGAVGGDLVLGTRDGSSCGPELRDLALAALAGQTPRQRQLIPRWPLDVAVDDPYRGGNIVASFGRPDSHVHALQLEVNRALYMDEFRLELAPVPKPAELEPGRDRSRPAQPTSRDRRRLLALASAIDSLVLALSVERAALADRSAAE